MKFRPGDYSDERNVFYDGVDKLGYDNRITHFNSTYDSFRVKNGNKVQIVRTSSNNEPFVRGDNVNGTRYIIGYYDDLSDYVVGTVYGNGYILEFTANKNLTLWRPGWFDTLVTVTPKAIPDSSTADGGSFNVVGEDTSKTLDSLYQTFVIRDKVTRAAGDPEKATQFDYGKYYVVQYKIDNGEIKSTNPIRCTKDGELTVTISLGKAVGDGFIFNSNVNVYFGDIYVSDKAGSNTPGGGDKPVDPSKPSFAVNIAAGIQNGTVTTNAKGGEADEGAEITVTATPATGYKLGAITVKTAGNKDVPVTNGKFTMPAEAVTVSATFEKDGGTGTNPPSELPNAPGVARSDTPLSTINYRWYKNAPTDGEVFKAAINKDTSLGFTAAMVVNKGTDAAPNWWAYSEGMKEERQIILQEVVLLKVDGTDTAYVPVGSGNDLTSYLTNEKYVDSTVTLPIAGDNAGVKAASGYNNVTTTTRTDLSLTTVFVVKAATSGDLVQYTQNNRPATVNNTNGVAFKVGDSVTLYGNNTSADGAEWVAAKIDGVVKGTPELSGANAKTWTYTVAAADDANDNGEITLGESVEYKVSVDGKIQEGFFSGTKTIPSTDLKGAKAIVIRYATVNNVRTPVYFTNKSDASTYVMAKGSLAFDDAFGTHANSQGTVELVSAVPVSFGTAAGAAGAYALLAKLETEKNGITGTSIAAFSDGTEIENVAVGTTLTLTGKDNNGNKYLVVTTDAKGTVKYLNTPGAASAALTGKHTVAETDTKAEINVLIPVKELTVDLTTAKKGGQALTTVVPFNGLTGLAATSTYTYTGAAEDSKTPANGSSYDITTNVTAGAGYTLKDLTKDGIKLTNGDSNDKVAFFAPNTDGTIQVVLTVKTTS